MTSLFLFLICLYIPWGSSQFLMRRYMCKCDTCLLSGRETDFIYYLSNIILFNHSFIYLFMSLYFFVDFFPHEIKTSQWWRRFVTLTFPVGDLSWLSFWFVYSVRASLMAQLVKNHLQCGRPGFNPWVGKIPWRRERLPTPVFWPGEFYGLYSPWGCKESDTSER